MEPTRLDSIRKSRLNDSFGSFGVRERGIINETRGTTLHYTTLYTIHYTTLHHTTLRYTTLHYTLRYTILHLLVLLARPNLQLFPGQQTNYTTLPYTILYYTALHLICLYFWSDQPCNYFQGKKHTTLHCTAQHYTTLHYTTLHYICLYLW